VAAIDLTPNFVEAARILTARCGLADRIEFRQANALALPFQDGTFDHVWSYAVTMNIADKEGLGREVARVLKPGGRFLIRAHWPEILRIAASTRPPRLRPP
jgi:ubiquinone/menaquinone biosynthesis C-methylase UbiE